MIEKSPGRLPAGFGSCKGGMDSGNALNAIEPDQIAFLVNGTVRGGFIRNRPGIKKVALRYVGSGGTEDATLKENAQAKLFQNATFYRADNNQNSIIASIGGRLFKYNISTNNSVQDISTPGDLNPNNLVECWMEQAENYLFISNGLSRNIFFNGSTARRAMAGEIMVSTVMAYGMGRMWFANPDRRSFGAGDIAFGPSGTAGNRYRDAVLKLTENTFLNEGGWFGVPSDSGNINAMRFVSIMDTSQGQGPLQVFTDESIFSVNAPVDRTTWKDLTNPIQTVSYQASGAFSQDSTRLVNGDVLMRCQEGIKSFVIARREFNTWANTPISTEMDRVLLNDADHLLPYASAAVFDNRYLVTVNPQYSSHGIWWKGLAVLDFYNVSKLRNKLAGGAEPCWDGLWAGLRILKVLTGKVNHSERCWLFTLNEDDEIELWEITKKDEFDNEDQPIQRIVETGSFHYGNPAGLKRLESAGFFLDEIAGNVGVVLQYRPDQHPLWRDWKSWNYCATRRECGTVPCVQPKTFQKQYRPRIRITQPPDDCDPVTGKPFRNGYEHQMRIVTTGSNRIRMAQMFAQDLPEAPWEDCLVEETCKEIVGCAPDPFAYQIEP